MLNFVVIILITRYLRKNLKTAEKLPYWDKVFNILFFGAIAGLGVSVLIDETARLMEWLAHAMLLYILYVLYRKKEFSSARSYMIAIAPFVLASLLKDTIQLVASGFYDSWENTMSAVVSFATVWLIAMLVINNRQQKALQKEKLRTKEEEEQNKVMTVLKSELEVQVAQRTAELTQQKEALQLTLDELKATQSQLIHSEKMASLGELTAGIAHEIQNPLNFVNNFSEVSNELLQEMTVELANGNREEALTIAEDVKQNLEKITHHGKRADAIVKGMLQHSRSSNGVMEPTDINALADEYFRLAYHGLRAKDKSFNATLKTDYDPSIGKISVLPQDLGRVVLNLITNAFYAVGEKKRSQPIGENEKAYEPTVFVSTKKSGDKVFITVKDNGNGIPQKVLDKIFQPFFTTKPTGQGTGLGLSLAYDIIKAHNGNLQVDTKENEGATFVIQLPAV